MSLIVAKNRKADIDVQLILEDSEHDLTVFDVDCALRPWPSTQGDLIQRKLGQITQSLYASHKYLSKYGAPTSVEDGTKGKTLESLCSR